MRPLTNTEIRKFFGEFNWKSLSDGRIEILGNWVSLNIVNVKMPVVGNVRCHKQISLDLYRIFTEISQAGLAKHIDVDEFRRNIAGCWVARHKCWDPSRMLSRHSWGIAIDFNIGANPYNRPSKQHPGVVEIFEDRGFYHGGRFLIKDAMHLEPSNFYKSLKQVTKIARPTRYCKNPA